MAITDSWILILQLRYVPKNFMCGSFILMEKGQTTTYCLCKLSLEFLRYSMMIHVD